PSEAVHAYLNELSGSTTQPKEETKMANTGTVPGAATASTQATTETQTIDTAALANEARTNERARVEGIQTCEEAKGRTQLASHLAFKTDMSVDAAKAILAAAPAEQQAETTPAANHFADAMNN